jgi:hypothetical protein
MAISTDEERAMTDVLARLNARAWGIALGLLCGGGLFLATTILLIKGGPNVGQHLSLLRIYFPGYSVSVVGAFIGFVYGFVLGYALGRVIGVVYNRLAGPKS